MKQLVFLTGNAEKLSTAKTVCEKYGINIVQKKADTTEIQEEDPEKVALDKAAKAFSIVKQPVVITDDSWSFSGLNGFPGVYMHSINEWFTPEDFLRLTLSLADREVVFTQYLVYTDGVEQKTFTSQSKGSLLKEIRGKSKHTSHTVIAMEGDGGLSIAEAIQASDRSARQSSRVWHDFAKWYSIR